MNICVTQVELDGLSLRRLGVQLARRFSVEYEGFEAWYQPAKKFDGRLPFHRVGDGAKLLLERFQYHDLFLRCHDLCGSATGIRNINNTRMHLLAIPYLVCSTECCESPHRPGRR